MSKVITKLLAKQVSRSNRQVLFHFFDYGAREIEAHNLLRSLVAQAVTLNPHSASILQQLYDRCFPHNPTLNDLLSILDEALAGPTHTFVIIDALDECSHPAELKQVFEVLKKVPMVHLLASGRDEAKVGDVVDFLSPESLIVEGRGVDKDIESYISRRLESNEDLELREDEGLIEKIRPILALKAQGR